MDSYWFTTSIGVISVSASAKGIAHLQILPLNPGIPAAQSPSTLLQEAANQISRYLTGQRVAFDLPIDWDGMTAFQHLVLKQALEIPYGRVLTYGELARKLGKPAASRAVGAALGRNPIPLVIPCHRVVAGDGSLTGYSAAEGIKTKQWLLELEGHHIVAQKLG